MRTGAKLLFIISLAAVLAACNSDKTGTTDNTGVAPKTVDNSAPAASSGDKPLVILAQANSADPWRQVFDAETKDAAAKQANLFTFSEVSGGTDDVSRQITDIENAIVKKPKVLLVSPVTTAAEKAIAEAHDKGIVVILLDRSVPGDKFDCWVGGDNHAIGKLAGDFMGKKLAGKGTVLMIQGIADAPPTKDRAAGFYEAMNSYPGIKVIKGDNCDYRRDKALTFMENFLQRHQAFDAVYAHNDEMAIGAYLAMKNANTPKKVIVGIDGCQAEVVNMIKEGKIDATFSYPDPGPKGIAIAADAINGKLPTSKKYLLASESITKETADAYAIRHPNLAK